MYIKRKLKLIKNYTPKISKSEDIEIYPNGVFNFFISKMLEDIEDDILRPKKVRIDIEKWLKTHYRSDSIIDKNDLGKISRKPIIQAEISPGKYEIIDGNHRFEKAFRDNRKTITSYKLTAQELVPYFYDKKGYECFVRYWNSKCDE